MLKKMCLLSAVLALAAWAANPTWADETNDPEAVAAKQKELIAVLESAAPQADKAITCKYLAVYGSKDAVPALAALLRDPELCSWARIALEAIPDAEADAAFREAAGSLTGRELIGVINSIGFRQDAEAVGVLSERLKDADESVVEVAAVALGKIGNADAVKALEPALKSGSALVRSGAAEGLILSAEKSLDGGNAAEAARIYELVHQAEVSHQRKLEATRGLILAKGADGVPLLVEQLRSDDKRRFALGLTVAREMGEPKVAVALVDEFKQAPPERQALLILVLADLGDKAALPALMTTAQTGPVEARIAALRVLEQLGDASCIPVLLEAATNADAELSQTALDVLAKLPGQDVDSAVAVRLAAADGAERRALIQTAGQRRIQATIPALVKAADDADTATRVAALTALGAAVDFQNLRVLIDRVSKPVSDADERAAAQSALSAAAQRMPDREACAAELYAAMASAADEAQIKMLEILTVMGGPTALKAVGEAAKEGSPELQDAGSRLLGEWMGVDAGPVLLDLAKTATDSKYEIRAIRGYIRLARQFNMPEPLRAAMCRQAFDVAKREAEKLLVLEVLERYPNIDTLKLAVETAKDPALKDAASASALVIAQKVSGDAIAVKDLLTQLGQEPVKVEITKATYGAGNKFVDVTRVLQDNVRDLPLIVLPSSSYNSAFGGDPASGVVKQLKVEYKMDGKAGQATFAENATIVLPKP